MPRKQIQRGGLAAPQIRVVPGGADQREQRHLTAAFLRIVAQLPRRPEPRHAWDNRARRDQRVPHPCTDAIALSRAALEAAYRTGNVDTIRATRLEVEEYFDQCRAAASTLPGRGETAEHERPLGSTSRTAPHLALIKEHSEATVAVAIAQAEPSDGAIERARREVRESIEAGREFLQIFGISLPSTRRVS